MTAATVSPEVAPLVRILTREQAIYQKLLEMATEERQAIIDGKLPRLKAALQSKQELLSALSELEDRRIGWLGHYAKRHQLTLDTLTLASIIEVSPRQDKQALTRVHAALRRRIDRLVEMNAVTRSLLEKVVNSIDTSLRFLLSDDGSSQTYGARGLLQPVAAGNRQLVECQA